MTPNTVLQSLNSQALEFLEENAGGGLHDVSVWVLRHFGNLQLSAIGFLSAKEFHLLVELYGIRKLLAPLIIPV